MPGHSEYRVVQLSPDTEHGNLVVIPVYYNEEGRIVGSADPHEANINVVGQDVIALMTTANEIYLACLDAGLGHKPILQLADLPGCDEYVPEHEREHLSREFIESSSSVEAIEGPGDTSGTGGSDRTHSDSTAMHGARVMVTCDAGFEPDPDRAHDDLWVDLGGEGG